MRTPIAQALAYPERIVSGVGLLDLVRLGALHFEEPDPVRFPALRLAYEVLASSGSAAAVFNAANEIAVRSFLEGRLPFLAIGHVIERTLERVPSAPVETLEAIMNVDSRARREAAALIGREPREKTDAEGNAYLY